MYVFSSDSDHGFIEECVPATKSKYGETAGEIVELMHQNQAIALRGLWVAAGRAKELVEKEHQITIALVFGDEEAYRVQPNLSQRNAQAHNDICEDCQALEVISSK